jgi:hypothetical protein
VVVTPEGRYWEEVEFDNVDKKLDARRLRNSALETRDSAGSERSEWISDEEPTLSYRSGIRQCQETLNLAFNRSELRAIANNRKQLNPEEQSLILAADSPCFNLRAEFRNHLRHVTRIE